MTTQTERPLIRFTKGAEPKPKAQRLALTTTLSLEQTTLKVRYDLKDLDDLILWPEPMREPGFADGLWQTTCFELFLACPLKGLYTEWNLAPTGAWAHYFFRSYREPLPEKRPLTPPSLIENSKQKDIKTLTAVIPIAALSQYFGSPPRDWHIQLSSVLGHRTGENSYWALSHRRGEPDFHASEAFVAMAELIDI